MAAGNPQNTNQDSTDLSESQSSQSKKGQAKKTKAGSLKKMTAKEQSERFIETARELGADESGEPFEKLIDIILPMKENNENGK